MKKRQNLLADEQWKLIEPLLPKPKQRRDKRGRPPAPNRACFEGILWVLQTGAAWRFLPDEFPSPSTCWRRLQRWQEKDVWLDAWRTLLGALDKRGLPARDIWIANLFDQVTKIRKTKDGSTVGAVQHDHILAAAAQGYCSLNLSDGHLAHIKITSEFLIGP